MLERNIDKEFQINTDFLDTIDFTHFLNQYRQLGEMMVAIEDEYGDSEMPIEIEGEIFNYYSTWDFKNYLEKRYNKQILFYPYEEYLICFVGE